MYKNRKIQNYLFLNMKDRGYLPLILTWAKGLPEPVLIAEENQLSASLPNSKKYSVERCQLGNLRASANALHQSFLSPQPITSQSGFSSMSWHRASGLPHNPGGKEHMNLMWNSVRNKMALGSSWFKKHRKLKETVFLSEWWK